MVNKGFSAERELLEFVSNSGNSVTFQKLGGNCQSFPVEGIKVFGHTTNSKVDLVINPRVRLQVKSTNSNRASIINQVPVRNFHKLGKREMLDVLPAIELFQKLEGLGTVKLADIANKEDWEEIVKYFLFEGTATRQVDKFFQATHLVEVGSDGNYLLIEKNQVMDYIWEKLTVELRTRKGKNEKCLHLRVGK